MKNDVAVNLLVEFSHSHIKEKVKAFKSKKDKTKPGSLRTSLKNQSMIILKVTTARGNLQIRKKKDCSTTIFL